MAEKLFGTDGIRGVANQYPMTAETAFRLAQVLGKLVCTAKGRAAIAKDTRISGDLLESAMIAGFASVGVNIIKMGVVPTPLLTSRVQSLDADAAVMITASHNPYQDNGIKLISSSGDKFSDEQTAQIEQLLLSDTAFTVSAEHIGKVFEDDESIPAYMENARKVLPDFNALKGLRVVLDCANGAFSKIMPQIFKDLGAGVISLADTPNGYNINHECGSQHTATLQTVVRESHAHLGIAGDGDGDRIIICDENGTRIDGDQIIAFLATHLHKNGLLKNNTVVATIWSNMGLEKYLHGLGINFCRSAVGERYVIEKMRETGSNLGGEESGHMVLSDYAKTGDALLTGLVISFGLLQSGKKMSEIFPLFQPCPCRIVSVRFSSAEDTARVFALPEVQKAVNQAKTRIEGRGSVIVRKSGTEPVIKIRVEADNEDMVSEIGNALVAEIENRR